MLRKSLALLVMVLAAVPACKSSTDFGGQDGKAANPAPAPTGVAANPVAPTLATGSQSSVASLPQTGSGSTAVSASGSADGTASASSNASTGCNPAFGQTVAVVLTPTVANNSPSTQFGYRISIQNCDGQSLPLTADKIDWDGQFAQELSAIPVTYTVTTSTGRSQSGSMTVFDGVDVFGDTGPGEAYWETNNAVDITGGPTSVVLTISTPNTTLVPDNQGGTVMSSYVRYGKAAPLVLPVNVN